MIPDRWAAGRVCVVQMGGIGDTVHTLPVLIALKRHAPACEITCILQPAGAALVRGHPAIDSLLVFDRSHGAWKAFRRLAASLRQPFDLVIDLNVALKASIATTLARAPVKLGFDLARSRDLNVLFTTHRIPPHGRQHVQDQYLEFVAALGVAREEPVTWDIGPWPAERDAQRAFFAGLERPAATMVIGTQGPERDWLPERWAELADVLFQRFGLQPVIATAGSPRERETERVMRERCRHRLVTATGLRALVGVLDGSALVVSLDTGPLHVAVALGRPVIALMGWNNPKVVGPWRRFHDLLVDAYGDPGEDYAPSTRKRKDRMRRITVGQVVEKVEVWRKRYANTA